MSSLTRRPPILNSHELPLHLTSTKPTTLQDPPTARPPLQTTIRTLSWSPLGTFLATGAADKLVRIWNPERTAIRNTTELRGSTASVSHVLWNPAIEGQLASITEASGDRNVRLWDMRSGKATSLIDAGAGAGGSEGNCALAWSPGADCVAVVNRNRRIRFFDPRMTGAEPSIRDYATDVQANNLTWSHNGNYLFIPMSNGDVDIVSWPSLERRHTLSAHTGACNSVEVDDLGEYLAIGSNDALISLWDTSLWMSRKTFVQCEGPVRTVSFSFDSSYLAAGTSEGSGVHVFNVESGELVHTVPTTHPSPCVRWHPFRYIVAHIGESVGVKLVGMSND